MALSPPTQHGHGSKFVGIWTGSTVHVSIFPSVASPPLLGLPAVGALQPHGYGSK